MEPADLEPRIARLRRYAELWDLAIRRTHPDPMLHYGKTARLLVLDLQAVLDIAQAACAASPSREQASALRKSLYVGKPDG